MIFVAGFCKSYSARCSSFLALPTRLKDVLKVAAPPYLYSGPSPIASLATTIAGLDVNERRGDLAPPRHAPQDAPGPATGCTSSTSTRRTNRATR